MAKKTAPLLPPTEALLHQLGERLRMARLRRRLTAKQVAERAGMAPMTLRSLERGGAGVTIGAYLAMMQVLGIENDLSLLGKADSVGRELQDAHLPALRKTTKTLLASDRPGDSNRPVKKPLKPAQAPRDGLKQGRFASSESLASLITPPPSPTKKRR